jgi:hypothetical protein
MLSLLVRIELPVEEQAPPPHAEPPITSAHQSERSPRG